MTDIDRPRFAEALMLLSETFNEPVSVVRAETYFDALRDLSLEDAARAVRTAIRSLRFFPKPIELRECVAGAPGDNADAAWGAMQREIRRVGYVGEPRFDDPKILLVIGELWGSWRRLCETLPAEGPEYVGWLKQFKQVYASVVARDHRVHAPTLADCASNVRLFIEGEQRALARRAAAKGQP